MVASVIPPGAREEQMLRIYFMQNWFNLSDPQAEDSLYDIESMRRFAGIDLLDDSIPDESTILRFRHLLERHQLTEQIFAEIRTLLEEKRLLLKSGTIVDATNIAAPPSTKNQEQARDPEMHQTLKNRQWHFGMKAHIGCDKRGIVHSLATTDAAAADISQMHKLLHGDESEVFGDQAYWSEAHRQAALARGIRYRVNRRGTESRPLTDYQRYINQVRSKSRARGEHAFQVVKHLWGFTKVRYRGLAKTPPACSPPSPSRTCTCSDVDCSHHRERVSNDRQNRKIDRNPGAAMRNNAPLSTSRMTIFPKFTHSDLCAAACAELP
jgi:IS5 family transposase